MGASDTLPPPKTRNFMDMEFSRRKNAEILGAHKIGAAISGPRIADKNFTDTRILKILTKEFDSRHVRPRQETEIRNFGEISPLDLLLSRSSV